MNPAAMGALPFSKYLRKPKGKENTTCGSSQIAGALFKGIYLISQSGYLKFSLCHDLSTCRCGQCTTCTMADCGTCRICGINQEQISKGETSNFDTSPHPTCDWHKMIIILLASHFRLQCKNSVFPNYWKIAGAPGLRYVCLNRLSCLQPVAVPEKPVGQSMVRGFRWKLCPQGY